MKEMCRNFICNNNRCQQANTAQTTSAFIPTPDTPMDNCNTCVMKRIGLAQAYIPSQPYTAPMEQEQSLVYGTTFTELVMPYCSGWNLYRFKEGV
jgi:hypothetical protein